MRNVNFGRVLIGVSIGLLLIGIVALARAVEPGWYAPMDGSGQSINVRCNFLDECVVDWQTYRTATLPNVSFAARNLITVVNESTKATPEEKALAEAFSELLITEQVWMISQDNCPRGEPCFVELARTKGRWFGNEFEFLPVEVTAGLEPTEDSLIVDFEAIRLFPSMCDVGSGGLILRDCIGRKEFFLLAR